MNTRLIALAAIAAGTVAAISADIPEGSTFEVPADQAEKLLTDKLAKLADEPLSQTPAPKVKTTRVRVLVKCQYGEPNDVADIPATELKQAKADGAVDDDKAAIAYALSLKTGDA
ncbi:MAG: hypothetical protein ACK5QH_08830 [Rubrivivax sp.]